MRYVAPLLFLLFFTACTAGRFQRCAQHWSEFSIYDSVVYVRMLQNDASMKAWERKFHYIQLQRVDSSQLKRMISIGGPQNEKVFQRIDGHYVRFELAPVKKDSSFVRLDLKW